ncbi:SPOR domain-containing protein [Altererythrobacter aquiaggeris]|uniref:SPOR domain-containing protein n=1 Tax=Aestuarierythrobacter aquiaggeris TaxID=1898396 RepID=UPI003017EF2C
MMAMDPREIDENGNPVEPDTEDYVEEFETDPDPGADQLNLAEEDESLPWLESSDYEDENDGVGAGRMVAFTALGLAALALLIWGIWWASNRQQASDIPADGSTIAAPEGDYKEKPDNPGGKQFEGTGDSSFARGEGQTREGRLAEKAVAKPSIDAATPGNTGASAGTAGAKPSPAATSGGYVVQVAALSTKAAAERGWTDLTGRTDTLKGQKYQIVEGQSDIGKVFRVQVVAGNKAAADRICAGLKSDGLPCTVKKN